MQEKEKHFDNGTTTWGWYWHIELSTWVTWINWRFTVHSGRASGLLWREREAKSWINDEISALRHTKVRIAKENIMKGQWIYKPMKKDEDWQISENGSCIQNEICGRMPSTNVLCCLEKYLPVNSRSVSDLTNQMSEDNTRSLPMVFVRRSNIRVDGNSDRKEIDFVRKGEEKGTKPWQHACNGRHRAGMKLHQQGGQRHWTLPKSLWYCI